MHHHARQHLAARTADRESSQSAMRKRIARRAAALEAAKVAAGIAASETDPGLRDLLAAFADVPVFVADADPDFAEAEADATWLDKPVRVGAWQNLMQRARADITTKIITSILRLAGFTVAHLLLRSHQRAAALHHILARLARDQISAIAHARLRVIHICISARAMRAGRVAVLASTAPACC